MGRGADDTAKMMAMAYKAAALMKSDGDAEHRVLAGILDHFNRRTGQCNPSSQTLGDRLGLDRKTVERAIAKLGGVLTITRRKGRSNAYRPKWDALMKIVMDWEATGKKRSNSRGVDAPTSPGGELFESRGVDAPAGRGVDAPTHLPPGRGVDAPRTHTNPNYLNPRVRGRTDKRAQGYLVHAVEGGQRSQPVEVGFDDDASRAREAAARIENELGLRGTAEMRRLWATPLTKVSLLPLEMANEGAGVRQLRAMAERNGGTVGKALGGQG